jgi:enoyl-CoA hydratase/carnithine racemase
LVIAAVQGFAIGGGAEIALAADFVIGGPNAKFKFPEVTLVMP